MKPKVVKDPNGLWRVENAPIVSTGIEYPLQSGPTTFTEAQLVDAVRAQEDPSVVSPRIKLGHSSSYNDALIGDAEMAFGRIDGSTMAMGDNNQTIYSDYLVPGWLGEVMSIAFPNRSLEGNFDVEMVTGKRYELVISAVSLLGIYWPGVQVLEDLPLWYGMDIPDGVEFNEAIAAQIESSSVAARGGRVAKIKADTDTEKIRREFYNEIATGDRYWWWIRGERVTDDGGLYLIVEDDDAGDLYKFNVSTDGDDIDFGEPVPVRVEYPEKTAAARAAVVAGMRAVDPKLLVHASRADTNGPDKSTQEGVSIQMDNATRKKLAASLSLPEDATEAQINAKLQGQALASATDPESGKPANEVKPEHEPPSDQSGERPSGTAPSGTPEEEAAVVERSQQGVESDEGDGKDKGADPDAEASIVRVDKKVWEETRAGAQAALRHEKARKDESINAKIDSALKAGKFKPANTKMYRDLLASDFEQGSAVIDSLQTGVVPLEERGTAGGSDDGSTVGAGGDGLGLPDQWFPGIAARRAAADKGARAVTYAKEG
jgi:hypothetical protein